MFYTPRPVGQALARYDSAPGSLLSNLVDSVQVNDEISNVRSENIMTNGFFSGDSSCLTSESSGKANVSPDLEVAYRSDRVVAGLERSYGLNDIAPGNFVGSGGNFKGESSLTRHSSSPAGFFSHLMLDNGFTLSRGMGSFGSQSSSNGSPGLANRRLKSQLNFSRQDSLSQISENSVLDGEESGHGGNSSDDATGNVGQSFIPGRFSMGSWDDTNSIVFATPNKRPKAINGELINGVNGLESQYGIPRTALEMSTVEKFLHLQQDSVPCKVRAKRGCATHPRSIAERERRTKISEKLRKLQELVPNMDKQTSTADMLDLAVQHIRTLQSQIQKLNQERANCTCDGQQQT